MKTIESNLKRYLDTERLLNEFFIAFDYCLSRCIEPALEKNGNKPVAACCQNKYYEVEDLEHPVFDLLRSERQKLYGTPTQQLRTDWVSPCEYHNPKSGCRLATHKSPVCVAFLCRNAIESLRREYDIYAYDYLGVYYALEWILTGDLPDHEFKLFRESILEMTRKVAAAKRL